MSQPTMSFEEMQSILQEILLSQQQFRLSQEQFRLSQDRLQLSQEQLQLSQQEFQSEMVEVKALVNSNSRAIQAMLDQAATDRLDNQERARRHEEEMRELKAINLLHQVVVLRASRKAPVLPAVEEQLIQQINQGIPSDLQNQYRSLQQKRSTETLTEAEHQILTQLSEQVEQVGAQRLEALANLAQLRQMPLLDLMETFGIQPVTYAG